MVCTLYLRPLSLGWLSALIADRRRPALYLTAQGLRCACPESLTLTNAWSWGGFQGNGKRYFIVEPWHSSIIEVVCAWVLADLGLIGARLWH